MLFQQMSPSVLCLVYVAKKDFLSEHLPDVRQPFKVAPEWMVLIDLGLSAREDPQQILSDLFECAYDQGLVQDGMIAQSEAQRADFWAGKDTMMTMGVTVSMSRG